MCIRDSLQCVGKAALQQNGRFQLSQLLQKLKVLHVARAHLDHVHVFKQADGLGVHDLGDKGQARSLAGFAQQRQPFGAHALEGVGGSARCV